MTEKIFGRMTTPHRVAALIVLAYAALGLLYSVITPPFEAPDEVGHFAFIVHLVQTGALPEQRAGDLGASHHPPLYYAIAAPFVSLSNLNDQTGAFRPNPNFIWAGKGGAQINAGLHGTAETFPFQGWSLGLHLARLVSVALGAVTVLLTIATGWLVFPENRWIGLLAGALVAFNPQFLFISGAVNNDNLLVAASTALCWQILRAMQKPERLIHWVFVGLILSVGILAKSSALIQFAIVALAILFCTARTRSMKLAVKAGGTCVLVVLVCTGWWFARNLVLYGDVLGWSKYVEVYAVNMRQSPLWPEFGDMLVTQTRSYWGVFGWMLIHAPDWYFVAVLVIVVFAVLGLVRFIAGARLQSLNTFQKQALLLLIASVLMQQLYLVIANTRFNTSFFQGRYLFSVIAPASILLSAGLLAWIPSRRQRISASFLGTGLALCAITMPFFVIQPAYASTTLSKIQAQLVPQNAGVQFGEMIGLKRYEVWAESQSRLHVRLYWQAKAVPDFDYTAFVHVLDANGKMVAQSDAPPGKMSGYTPAMWLPGDIVVDDRIIDIPSTTSMNALQVAVGLYNWQTGQRLSITGDTKMGDQFTIPALGR